MWDGVYSSAQASRGEAAFDNLCESCHRGGFQGPQFMQRWREDKLAAFYNFMSTKMPISAPGMGTRQQYLDILAWVLSTNRFPAGSVELTAADLTAVQIVGKDGPQPVPDGSLIWSVGCLHRTADDVWTLTKATEPVRTREAVSPPEVEMAAAARNTGGNQNFRFVSIDSLHPAPLDGRRIMARGFIDREPTGNRLVATALLPLGPACTD